MYLDTHLSWDVHIKQLSLKLSRDNGILSKLRYFASVETCLKLYHAIILLYHAIILLYHGSFPTLNLRTDVSYGSFPLSTYVRMYPMEVFRSQLTYGCILWKFSPSQLTYGCILWKFPPLNLRTDVSYGSFPLSTYVRMYPMEVFPSQLTYGCILWEFSTLNLRTDVSYGVYPQNRILQLSVSYKRNALG